MRLQPCTVGADRPIAVHREHVGKGPIAVAEKRLVEYRAQGQDVNRKAICIVEPARLELRANHAAERKQYCDDGPGPDCQQQKRRLAMFLSTAQETTENK